MLEPLKKPARFFLNKALQLKTKLAIKHLKNKPIILLEIGAGNKRGTNGWITLDTARGADLQWDLRNGIPFPDSSMDKIYTSHTFEHIPFPSLQILIRECRRTLKPQGSLSVCVPNARFYIDAYLNGKLFRDQSTFWQPGICETGSAIDQLNYIAYMGGEHRYMFDEENLIKVLRQNGFEQAELRSFDSTIDLPERDHESIYAIGTK
ncbi:MAG: methyltransferase domain-containing protein [Synechococcus sp.]|nr:methyltransferase domain-containing protein [Synechococcus sp.]